MLIQLVVWAENTAVYPPPAHLSLPFPPATCFIINGVNHTPVRQKIVERHALVFFKCHPRCSSQSALLTGHNANLCDDAEVLHEDPLREFLEPSQIFHIMCPATEVLQPGYTS